MSGRYGPYVKWGKVNATLPKDRNPEETTLEEAMALIAARAAKGQAKKPARKASKPRKAKRRERSRSRRRHTSAATRGKREEQCAKTK